MAFLSRVHDFLLLLVMPLTAALLLVLRFPHVFVSLILGTVVPFTRCSDADRSQFVHLAHRCAGRQRIWHHHIQVGRLCAANHVDRELKLKFADARALHLSGSSC